MQNIAIQKNHLKKVALLVNIKVTFYFISIHLVDNFNAIFFDKNGLVLYVAEQMKPWRFGRFVRGSRYTLELPGGSLGGRVKKGDEVILS